MDNRLNRVTPSGASTHLSLGEFCLQSYTTPNSGPLSPGRFHLGLSHLSPSSAQTPASRAPQHRVGGCKRPSTPYRRPEVAWISHRSTFLLWQNWVGEPFGCRAGLLLKGISLRAYVTTRVLAFSGALWLQMKGKGHRTPPPNRAPVRENRLPNVTVHERRQNPDCRKGISRQGGGFRIFCPAELFSIKRRQSVGIYCLQLDCASCGGFHRGSVTTKDPAPNGNSGQKIWTNCGIFGMAGELVSSRPERNRRRFADRRWCRLRM